MKTIDEKLKEIEQLKEFIHNNTIELEQKCKNCGRAFKTKRKAEFCCLKCWRIYDWHNNPERRAYHRAYQKKPKERIKRRISALLYYYKHKKKMLLQQKEYKQRTRINAKEM